MLLTQAYSVVMTAYNAEKTIGRSIESALSFGIPASEIVVIDDCSKDSTLQIIHKYAKLDSRIVMISNPTNLGQSKSRNMGVILAKNDLIIFMDDDDQSLPSRAALHLSLFESGNVLTYVSTIKQYVNGYFVRYENSTYLYNGKNHEKIIRYLVLGEKQDLFENLFSPSCALAVHRSSFLEIGGFQEDLRRLEDIDLVCRALESKLKIAWSPEVGVVRLDTQGEDKNAVANANAELLLLNTFENYFSQKERLSFRLMVDLRKKYFAKQRFALFFSFPQALLLMTIHPKKFINIFNRIVHDSRKQIP